jgi:phosphate transport system permease protein
MIIRQRKFLEEKFFICCMWISAALICAVMILIVGSLVYKGFSAMSIEMLTKPAEGGFYLGGGGGILHAIIGSFYIAGGGTLAALVFSIPVVIFLNVYLKKDSEFAVATRFALDVLAGLPSIVCGTLAFTVMIYFGMKASLLGGIIAIGILVSPIMCRSIDAMAHQIPDDLLISTYALGATKFEAGFLVFFKQLIPGVITSFLLAFGRGIGDAAAVLFTAGFSDNIPASLFKPAATLPLAIFFQLEMPSEEVRSRAYASAFILTLIILAVSLSGRFISVRFLKYKIK